METASLLVELLATLIENIVALAAVSTASGKRCNGAKHIFISPIGNWAFSGCSSLTGVTIPNGVSSIARGAFEHCESLTCVTIGNSVTVADQAEK